MIISDNIDWLTELVNLNAGLPAPNHLKKRDLGTIFN